MSLAQSIACREFCSVFPAYCLEHGLCSNKLCRTELFEEGGERKEAKDVWIEDDISFFSGEREGRIRLASNALSVP